MTEMAGERSPELAFVVVNRRGLPVTGARIEIRHEGVLVGELTSAGGGTIATDSFEGLEITALYGQDRASAIVSRDERKITLVIPTVYAVELASVPTVRCPDGTSGQPCVTCRVNGRDYLICG